VRLLPLVALLLLAVAPVYAQAPPDAGGIVWPDLPTEGFLAGRPATTDDVAAGRAQFALAGGGFANPIDIDIPQYALLRREDGTHVPGIVLQAEEAQGLSVAAFRALGGDSVEVVLVDELTLLGRRRPR